jgi:hypothetical protein
MLRSLIWIVIAVFAAACGSKKEDAPKAAAGSGSAPTPAAGSGSGEHKVAEADLFTGTSVTLPTPAAKLKFGMTEAEAKAAAPELFAQKYGYEVPGTKVNYAATKIATQIDNDRLWNIRAELTESQDQAKDWLAKKWGPPVEHKNSIGTPQYFWSSNGMQAKLEQQATKSAVYFQPMMPREQLLGSDPKHLGVELIPLIGASPDDVKKAYAAYTIVPAPQDPDSFSVSFPPSENGYEGVGSTLNLHVKKGKVSGYTFGYVAGDPKDVDALVARLEQIYGNKGKKDGTGLYTDYAKNVKAEIRKDAGFSTTVWVGDTKK